MTHHTVHDDPRARLAQSRQSIVQHIQARQERRSKARANWREAFGAEPGGAPDAPGLGRRLRGRLDRLADAARLYWQDHPARWALQLATPALSRYARRRPLSFVALSAAAGALACLSRPWRLVSVTGLAVTALRSPRILRAVSAALYADPPERPPH